MSLQNIAKTTQLCKLPTFTSKGNNYPFEFGLFYSNFIKFKFFLAKGTKEAFLVGDEDIACLIL